MFLRRFVPWPALPLLAVVPAVAQAVPSSVAAAPGTVPTCTAPQVLLNHPDVVAQHFGASIAVADLNHDGVADLAVGAPQDLDHFPRSGQVYAYISSMGTGPGAPRVLAQSAAAGLAEPGDDYGTALAAGDLNGDGYADLVVGDPGEAAGTRPAGGAYAVFMGGRAGPGNGTFRTWSSAVGDRFGAALAICDFNHDGYADLAVGVPGRDAGAGAVVVYDGSRAGPGAGHVLVQEGHGGHSEPGDHFGAAGAAFGSALAIGGAGRGKHADLLVGAPASPGVAGAVDVFAGTGGGVGHGHQLVRAATGRAVPRPGDGFGSAVAVGDTDDDGYADVVVGAPGSSPVGGVVDVFGGGPSGVDTGRPGSDADLGVGEAVDSRVGAAVAVGDLTGDGRPDVIAGAPGMLIAGQSGAGAVHVAAGCPDSAPTTTALPAPIRAPAG